MFTKLDIILFTILGCAILMGLFWVIRTEKRLRRFFLGKKAQDLETTIVALEDNIIKLNSAKEKIEEEIKIINQKLRKSVRGVETIRFNPFPDQGSNQSFAIGILNEDADGVVISSLYSRERMSIFAKPIKGGKSEYELTDEEKTALEKAKV